ncbi:g3330 [Coccomyxa elongata]
MFHQTIRALSEAGLLLAAGAFARNLGFLESTDAQLGLKAAAYTTLPALALQILSVPGVAGPQALIVLAASAAFSAAVALLGWLIHGKRRAPERALLTGSAVGVALGTFGLPFVEAAFGAAGVRIALLWDLANVAAVYVLAYLVFASGGSTPAAIYEHADGGTYRGQWRGNKKQGLGVYVYPGGGRYEGMWRENGGWYEGEWVAGEREGTGARLMRNGTIKAGRWGNAKLEKPMDPLDCAYAVSAAQKAASAARRVKVGGGRLEDAVMNMAMQPVLWAGAAALRLSYSGSPLPAMVDAVTGTLARAHLPLVLLCSGILLTAPRPKVLQVRDTANVLLARYVSPLLLAAAAAVSFPSLSLLAAVAGICALSPAPPALVDFARGARINDSFMTALAPLSALTSAVLMTLLTLIASSQVPPPLTTAEAALPPVVPPLPFAAAAAGTAAAVSIAAFLYVRLAGRTRRGSGGNAPKSAVRMTLQGTPPQTMPPISILEPPAPVAAETTAVEKDQDAGVSAEGPAESFVEQLGVDESAADISTPQEATEEDQSAEGTQEGSSAGEAASSRRGAAGPAGTDPSGGRGRRRGWGAFRDVDDEGPGGASASAGVLRRCAQHALEVRVARAPYFGGHNRNLL